MTSGLAPVPGTSAAGDFALLACGQVNSATYTVTNVSGALYLVSMTSTCGSSNLNNNGVIRYAASSGNGFRVSGFSMVAAAVPSPYLKTGATAMAAQQGLVTNANVVAGNVSFGSATAQAQATTGFWQPNGAANNGNEYYVAVPASTSFRLSTLYCVTDVTPASGQTIIFTMRSAFASTALTCTINNPATTCNDLTDTAWVAAGTQYSLQAVTSATSGSIRLHCSARVN